MTLHDFIADPWSVDVVGYQALSTYGAYMAGRPSHVRGPAVDYCDWALWQRRWVASPAGVSQLVHWRERLAELAPAEFTSGASAADRMQAEIAGRLVARLHVLARAHDATLFMVLVAAVQALLAAASGRSTVAVGCPTPGRVHRALDAVVGPFLNPLVLVGDLSGDPRFEELVETTRRRALEAYTNQLLPYERLISELAPERNALFDVAVTYHQRPDPPPAAGGLVVSDLGRSEPRTTIAIEVAFIERADDFLTVVTHQRASPVRERAQVLARHLPELLARVADEPETRLSELCAGAASLFAHAPPGV
jgi:hypothetical protein